MLKAKAPPDPQAAQVQSRCGEDKLALVLGAHGWGTGPAQSYLQDRSARANCPATIQESAVTATRAPTCRNGAVPLGTGRGKRYCQLPAELRMLVTSIILAYLYPWGRQLSLFQRRTRSPGTLGARILPVSELFCDVDPYPAFRTSVWKNGSDLKALSCSEGPGEPAGGPPPLLTCREMRSTSHSSSHSWATADMATTVATRMATSPICRGRATRRSGGARAWTAQGSPVCGGGREEVQRQREGPSHRWGEWGVRERPT